MSLPVLRPAHFSSSFSGSTSSCSTFTQTISYTAQLAEGCRIAADRKATTERAAAALTLIETMGALKEQDVRDVVQQHQDQVRDCYVEGLRQKNDLRGEMVVKWTIDQNGDVPSANVVAGSMHSKTVELCLVKEVKQWRFPAPSDQGLVIVSHGFDFSLK